MRMLFRSMKWMLLLSGMLVSILGISMLFMPLNNLTMLVIIIGVGMLISGISEIVSYYNEEKEHRLSFMLASGILSTLLGVWTVFGSGMGVLATALPFVFAVWVMTSGIIRIVSSLSLKAEGFDFWVWMLVFGILGAVFGFLLLFSPLLSSMIISVSLAIMLISHGIGNIIIFYRINKAANYFHTILSEREVK